MELGGERGRGKDEEEEEVVEEEEEGGGVWKTGGNKA